MAIFRAHRYPDVRTSDQARMRALASFADDQVTVAVDDPDLPLENKGGGVELGQNGEAFDARASAEVLTGKDRGLFGSAFQKYGTRTPARPVQPGRGFELVEARRRKHALGVNS